MKKEHNQGGKSYDKKQVFASGGRRLTSAGSQATGYLPAAFNLPAHPVIL
jgi:hypothetical protein